MKGNFLLGGKVVIKKKRGNGVRKDIAGMKSLERKWGKCV